METNDHVHIILIHGRNQIKSKLFTAMCHFPKSNPTLLYSQEKPHIQNFHVKGDKAMRLDKTNAMRKPKSETQKRIPSFAEVDDESPSSPLRFHSPLRSDDPDNNNNSSPLAKPIAPIRSKRRHPFSQRTLNRLPSPLSRHSQPSHTQPETETETETVVAAAEDVYMERRIESSPLPIVVVRGEEEAVNGTERERSVGSILRRSRKEEAVERAALGIRVCEVVMCVVSFAVMASDKTPGWSGDSFDRYKEYRYCLGVAIIAFVYSGFQVMDLACSLVTGRHLIQCDLRYYFDFCMDQVLAYLLISASSSAATRVNDWQSNWGNDEFTMKATASVSMAFLAFIFFAMSSIISGYNFVAARNSTY